MAHALPPLGRLDHPIPAIAGVGLKPEHYAEVLAGRGRTLWFEIHPENYMGAGGPPHRYLEAIRSDHALSMHGVGLSLGSADGIRTAQLDRLKALARRYQPELLSEHLSWSGIGAHLVPDLLPVPLHAESLARFAESIDRVQTALKRTILIENPSLYLAPNGGDIPEPEFIATLCRRTGCGWLLDINNVFVSATNLGFDVTAYLDAVDPALVGEIHLAGHARERHAGGDLLIDDHGARVPEVVWWLFGRYVARAGPTPTLVEWDTRLPDFTTLAAEAAQANVILRTTPASASSHDCAA
jgi:uncharacterized protein (UPF0276 family)